MDGSFSYFKSKHCLNICNTKPVKLSWDKMLHQDFQLPV